MSIDEIGNNQIESEENERNLLDLAKIGFSIVWEFKTLIIILTILGAILSVSYAIMTLRLPLETNPMPNIYRAYTRVLIQEGSTSGNDDLVQMMTMLGIGGAGNQPMSKGALAQMVYESFPFADGIINEFDLKRKVSSATNIKHASRAYFYTHSSFIYYGHSGELIISFTSSDKYLATEIVIYMLEDLQRWFHEQGGVVSESQIANIEAKLFEVSTEMNSLQGKIKNMQQRYGVLNIDDLAEAQQILANDLNTQLMNLDLQISQQENAQASYSPVELGTIRELRGQREDVANTLERLEAGLPVGDKVYPPSNELPNLSSEFEQLQLLYDIQSGIYLSLTEQYELLKLSRGGVFSFTVLEPAEVPEQKYGPKRSQMCMVVTFFFFMIGVLIAFGIFFLRKYTSRSELTV